MQNLAIPASDPRISKRARNLNGIADVHVCELVIADRECLAAERVELLAERAVAHATATRLHAALD